MKALHIIGIILLIIGGLAWGIYGLFDVMVVSYLGATLAKIVYVLVGLAGLYEIFAHKANCKACASQTAAMPKPAM